jgi:enamine deaminase RidA (YjgF/YER057c/UK114 family)
MLHCKATLAFLLLVVASNSPAADIVRRPSPGFPIASSVTVPAGAELLFVSGTLADVANPGAPAGSVERFGDTATQATSVLAKLEKQLQAAGMSMGDVVKMNVFLVGDPKKGGAMDFEGLMQAYSRHFGTEAQKNLPARTTVQVAGLPLPGALVEIEVIAAKR